MTTACACDGPNGAFVADGDRWQFRGTLTFEDAPTVLEGALRLPLPGSGVIDLSGLVHADSAALAVLLALQRRGTAEQRPVAFAGMPPTLDTLARVYGIEELLQR